MISTKLTLSPRSSWIFDFYLLGCLITLLYLCWLGHYPLFIRDEGRYSEIAREMLVSHDFITPRLNGVVFLDKPIFYYWLQAISMHVFGVNEWAIRFFPALISIMGCLFTYTCGRLLFNRRTGLLAAAILALSPLYFGGAHYADQNLEVAVFISCALLAFLTGTQTSGGLRRCFMLFAYVFAALAFLTKGLIGVAFPGMIAGTWLVLTHQWREIKHFSLVTGIGLFLAIVLPWYVLAQQANPAFLHYFFITQQVSRFLSAGTFNNPSPIWFYVPVILVGFLPWTLFLLPALARAIKTFRSHSNPLILFLLLWIGMITLFFSIPSAKTVGYIYPVFPALALLTAQYLDANWHHRIRYVVKGCAAITTIFFALILYYSPAINQDTTKPLANELKSILTPDDLVVNYFKYYQDLSIYLQQPLTLVADWESPTIPTIDNWKRELWYGVNFQGHASSLLVNEDVFWQQWHSQQRIFAFVSDNYLSQFKSHAKYYFYVDSYHDINLLCNHPAVISTLMTKHPEFTTEESKYRQNREHDEQGYRVWDV